MPRCSCRRESHVTSRTSSYWRLKGWGWGITGVEQTCGGVGPGAQFYRSESHGIEGVGLQIAGVSGGVKCNSIVGPIGFQLLKGGVQCIGPNMHSLFPGSPPSRLKLGTKLAGFSSQSPWLPCAEFIGMFDHRVDKPKQKNSKNVHGYLQANFMQCAHYACCYIVIPYRLLSKQTTVNLSNEGAEVLGLSQII